MDIVTKTQKDKFRKRKVKCCNQVLCTNINILK